ECGSAQQRLSDHCSPPARGLDSRAGDLARPRPAGASRLRDHRRRSHDPRALDEGDAGLASSGVSRVSRSAGLPAGTQLKGSTAPARATRCGTHRTVIAVTGADAKRRQDGPTKALSRRRGIQTGDAADRAPMDTKVGAGTAFEETPLERTMASGCS